MEQKEENLVKKTCRELGITQKELAKMLDVSQDTVTNWTKGEPKQIIKVLLEALIYKKKFHNILKIVEFQILPLKNSKLI
ncbi:Helix-turn-helix protein [Thiovulum sp. ES]|nr:Helix-turn-helix protein [Thiovulum sp. ES]